MQQSAAGLASQTLVGTSKPYGSKNALQDGLDDAPTTTDSLVSKVEIGSQWLVTGSQWLVIRADCCLVVQIQINSTLQISWSRYDRRTAQIVNQ